MPTLEEVKSLRESKMGEMNAIFEKMGKDAHGNQVFDIAKAGIAPDEIKKRNDELAEIGQQYDALIVMDAGYQALQAEVKAQRRPVTDTFGGGGQLVVGNDATARDMQGAAVKTLEKAFVKSDGYKTWADNPQPMRVDLKGMSVKTLLTTSAGYLPYAPAETRIVPFPNRRPVVSELIPQDDTVAPAIQYMEETLFTNNAASVAEGALKPESALQFTRRVVPMTKIATTLPVTQEQMLYVPAIEGIIRDRLRVMLLLEEDRQLLNGNPGGANPAEFTGFLNKTGVQVQAKGADDVFTAIYKGITLVRDTVGFADPTGIVIHPNNWLVMRTTKDSTGRFILGNPDEIGPERLWGLPVIPTIAEPAGTALLGDFRMYSHIDRAMEITLRMGYINDDFSKNIVRLLIEEFITLEVYRPVAFCTVTGLP